jgi:hypothetical protein
MEVTDKLSENVKKYLRFSLVARLKHSVPCLFVVGRSLTQRINGAPAVIATNHYGAHNGQTRPFSFDRTVLVDTDTQRLEHMTKEICAIGQSLKQGELPLRNWVPDHGNAVFYHERARYFDRCENQAHSGPPTLAISLCI